MSSLNIIKSTYEDIYTDTEKIKLVFNNVPYYFCAKNIKWFTLKVTGKQINADTISHPPSKCGLLHYNPRDFKGRKLCGYSLSKLPCPFGIKCNMLHPDNFPAIIKNDNDSNIEKVINDNNKQYNSAGVLIVTTDNGFNYLNLFKSSTQVNKGVNAGNYYYGIAGGGINKKDDSIEASASRELYEESCKTISISTEILKNLKQERSYIEIIGKTLSGQRKPGLFACYICNLDIIGNCLKSFYNNNKDALNDSTSDIVYNETLEIDRFCFETIQKKIYNMKYIDIKPMKFENHEGEYKFIDERTLKCIWQIIQANSNIISNCIKISNFEVYDDNEISSFILTSLSEN